MIEDAAAAAGRSIDPEHYGAMVLYARDEIPDALRTRLGALRPEADSGELVAVGPDSLRERLTAYAAVDVSKLVVVPLAEPTAADGGWDAELRTLADAILDLQT